MYVNERSIYKYVNERDLQYKHHNTRQKGGKIMQIKCVDCPYYWKEENEKTPHCHYTYDDGYAPCEVDDYETEDDE